MIAQPSLFETPAWFDGKTYNPEHDAKRLGAQLESVKSYMLAHGWVTLEKLCAVTGAKEQSVSARLRDLRKPRFGGYIVSRRRVDGGLYEYRVTK